ncbi:uncharacterized protein PG986_000043 [Apiospora aurea]|uniref:Heterokaryon incompatibility domain-containing protein n=1 Tax=Apiospora aurea TaxID=335848 RepID=A0ABR1QSV9_9PEZI
MDFDRRFEGGEWGFLGTCRCLGQRLLARIFYICMFSGIRTCSNPSCQARKPLFEASAPACEWGIFRQFVVLVLSCRLTYWANALDSIVKMECYGQWQQKDGSRRVPSRSCLDLHGVWDICEWAARCVATTNWPSDPRISRALVPGYQARALHVSRRLHQHGICPTRVWNIAIQGHLGVANIHHVGAAITQPEPLALASEHSDCTDQYCQLSNSNSTLIQQGHKPAGCGCDQELYFDPALLNQAEKNKHNMAWRVRMPNGTGLCDEGDSYMAISHVWADGTGVGMKQIGRMNRCLWQYFRDIAISSGIECQGIWWDAISIPTDRDLRRKAIDSMLANYEMAKVTLVHDQQLADTEWKEDGSPAVAIILSSWFTRGWTAGELFASKDHAVKFVFRGSDGNPSIKDLDCDILADVPDQTWPVPLARSEKIPTLGHLVASDIIRLVRQSGPNDSITHEPLEDRRPMVHDLEQLLSILQPRTTSWAIDRMIIAGLLCLPPEEISSTLKGSEITKKLLIKFGSLRLGLLIHDEVPVAESGPWSWCPQSIFDLGRFAGGVGVRNNNWLFNDWKVDRCGSLRAKLLAYEVEESDLVIPHSQHASVATRIEVALSERQQCILLTSSALLERDIPMFLLAQPFFISGEERLSCQWVGWAYLQRQLGLHLRLNQDEQAREWHLSDRKRLPGVSRRYEVLPNSTVLPIFGNHPRDVIREITPLNFNYTSWALQVLRSSGRNKEGEMRWILSESFFDEKGDLIKMHRGHPSAHPTWESRRKWMPQLAYVHPLAVSLIHLVGKEPVSPPLTARLEIELSQPYNLVAESFLETAQRRHLVATKSPCQVVDDCHECLGMVLLAWSFPYPNDTQEFLIKNCAKIIRTIFRSPFHIVPRVTVDSEPPPISLLIGQISFMQELRPLLRYQKDGINGLHGSSWNTFIVSAASCLECEACMGEIRLKMDPTEIRDREDWRDIVTQPRELDLESESDDDLGFADGALPIYRSNFEQIPSFAGQRRALGVEESSGCESRGSIDDHEGDSNSVEARVALEEAQRDRATKIDPRDVPGDGSRRGSECPGDASSSELNTITQGMKT